MQMREKLTKKKEETGMSRVGKMPIAIPAGVTVDIAENNLVTVKGPKGELKNRTKRQQCKSNKTRY